MNTIYYFAWLIFYQLAAITSFVVFFDVRSDFALFDFFDHKAFTDAGFPPETHLWFAIVAISGFIINWLILMRIYVIDPEAKKDTNLPDKHRIGYRHLLGFACNTPSTNCYQYSLRRIGMRKLYDIL